MQARVETSIFDKYEGNENKLQDQGDKMRDRLVVSDENRDMYLKGSGRKRMKNWL